MYFRTSLILTTLFMFSFSSSAASCGEGAASDDTLKVEGKMVVPILASTVESITPQSLGDNAVDAISVQTKRTIFEAHINALKEDKVYQGSLDKWRETSSTLFISYSWRDEANKEWVNQLCEDLVLAGIPEESIYYDYWHSLRKSASTIPALVNKIKDATKVIVIGSITPKDVDGNPKLDEKGEQIIGLRDKYTSRDIYKPGVVTQELDLLCLRRAVDGGKGVIPVYYEGKDIEALPDILCTLDCVGLEGNKRFTSFYDILQKILNNYIESPVGNPISKAKKEISRWFSNHVTVLEDLAKTTAKDTEAFNKKEEERLRELFARGTAVPVEAAGGAGASAISHTILGKGP